MPHLAIRPHFRLAFLASLALAAVAHAQTLTHDVRNLVDRYRLGPAKVGVILLDAETGATLASYNADEPLIPASNMKVLSSGAALASLGSSFHFETTLERDGDRLIVRGAGDPAFGDPVLLKEMGLSVDQIIGAWVAAVRESGPTPPTELVVDDRVFDRDFVHSSWPADQLNRWYCAQVAGLNFHTNILSIFATPTQPDRLPTLAVEPRSDWLNLQNKAVTVAKGSNKIGATRVLGTNEITFRGEVRFPAEEPVDVAIHDPPAFFLRLFTDRLRAAGLGPANARVADPFESLPPARVIAVVRTPMSVVLRRCNVNSYNLYADCLLKRMGHAVTGQPGSWENGAAVMRMIVQQRLGPADAAALAAADGSGMSRENRVTAGLLGRWLLSMGEDPAIAPAFLESLPAAGRDGSLKARFRNKRLKLDVRAKTGYIRSVSSLSGYITDAPSDTAAPGAPRIAFSIIVNDWPSGSSLAAVRSFQEDVAMLAHDWAARTPVQALGGQ